MKKASPIKKLINNKINIIIPFNKVDQNKDLSH